MKLYEDYSQSPDGWNVSATLKVEDDGRFVYEELWTDYTNVSLGGGAEGTWRRAGGGIVVFLAERVEGSMYFAWEAGQVLEATEQGDTLDFGRGVSLRVPPERKIDIPVRNTGTKPLTVVLEPWGIRHVVAPGEGVRIVAQGPWGPDGPEIVKGADEFVFYGWSGSRAAVVPEPKLTGAAVPTRAPGAEAARRPVKPPVTPPAPTPADDPKYARFEPRTPSAELAARIRHWVDELPTEGMQNWIGHLCKSNDAIPLHCTQLDLWALRPDGQVLCIDHESSAQRAEPEHIRQTAYAVLAKGAATHPELWELLPPDRAGLRQCELCGGKGWTEAQPPAQGTDYCHRCDGIGWYAPRVPG